MRIRTRVQYVQHKIEIKIVVQKPKKNNKKTEKKIGKKSFRTFYMIQCVMLSK